MATKLLSAVWPRITSLVTKNRKRCHVAVAYFGQGASKMLPLPAGSTLVVNMSVRSVKEGSTCPAEIANMLNRDVVVYSCNNLHAKVFVIGDRAIVGSSNVSKGSRDTLIEAAVETTDSQTVRSCMHFIDQNCRKRLSWEDVERLSPLYKPPRGGGLASNLQGPNEGIRPLWAVGLSRVDWDEEDTRQADKARPLAKMDLGNAKLFRLEEFCWTGHDLRGRLSETDWVMQVLTEQDKKVIVHPPSEVIRVVQYHVGTSPRMIVFLRQPRRRTINIKLLTKQIEAPTKVLKKLKRVRLLKNQKLVGELLGLWRLSMQNGQRVL